MIRIERVADRARFEALEHEWQAVLHASRSTSPFLNFGWLFSWWGHLAGSRRLSIAAIRVDDRLIGIAPLHVAKTVLPYCSRVEFLGTGFAGSDYLDIFAEPDHENLVAEAVCEFARTSNVPLRLENLPSGSCASLVTSMLIRQGWAVRQTPSGVCPYIPLAGHSWDSFLAALPGSHRTTIRRRLNSLEKKFEVRFDRVCEELGRRHAIDALASFHRERFALMGGSTAFGSSELLAFHHEATRRAMAEGWLRLYTLRLQDDIAAVMYGFSFKGRFYFYQHGFARKYSNLSVGRAVVELTIREALDERCGEFDMLWGEETYKAFWPIETRTLTRLEIFPPHIVGRIHHHTTTAERTMRKLARRVVSIYSHGLQAN